MRMHVLAFLNGRAAARSFRDRARFSREKSEIQSHDMAMSPDRRRFSPEKSEIQSPNWQAAVASKS